MPSGNRSFPHYFGNRERLPLNNEPPLIEHPLTPDKPYERDSNPGSARIITNWWDRSTPEVVYHDPLTPPLPGATYPPFKMANYRPASRDGVEGSEAAAPNDELGRTGLATLRRSTSL
ncbi:hypothetical protein N656DRAFT_784126 [Canariomyces notabilis]|uniref:Uncharacterized protein n=1 Tax=Canariomyces notabilis TaxID=2074819 RepID=A0AAN6QGK2_9PEZI|nr:hypothetical protein N656DRAFT_784126 [Canariomyces arenarius]